MRQINQLVHSRTRVEPRYALMPLEGFPISKLPVWPGCDARVLASPALGAKFIQTLLEIPAGRGTGHGEALLETFGYVLSGRVGVTINGDDYSLGEGGFFFIADHDDWMLKSDEPSRVLLFEKRYEADGLANGPVAEAFAGHAADVPAEVWSGDEGARLQTLVPDTMAYDLAINIFTFQPGHGLPIVETHVMEHGALILEGKGLYFLADRWMEVEAGDFIYMAPFCPQSFYATGAEPAKYIYYKNVNREIAL